MLILILFNLSFKTYNTKFIYMLKMVQKLRNLLNKLKGLKTRILGKPLNPFSRKTHHSISLIAFFAWIGLGADCISSVSYGPEQAFIALNSNYHLGIFIALLTFVTVFILCLSYNQVIELFPHGGGGYKAASELVSPLAGLIAGSALLVDYVLTVTISVAASVSALANIFDIYSTSLKVDIGLAILISLILLNFRGMKESIKILAPIFLGFILSHFLIILYGIFQRADQIPSILPESINDTIKISKEIGWLATLSLFFKAYSLGAGTYTGIEAVSSNITMLSEPRIKTGKTTTMYMAFSLSFMALGLIIVYTIWYIQPAAGKTLNFAVFSKILGESNYKYLWLFLLSFFEAAVLIVAANSGFLGGSSILASLSRDQWLPNYFSSLSERLVKQNAIAVIGVFSIILLLWTRGKVDVLVVLYSLNVFIAFILSFLGICCYHWKNRVMQKKLYNRWFMKFFISLLGFLTSLIIFIIIILEKFTSGAWVAIFLTAVIALICMIINDHYKFVNKYFKKIYDNKNLQLTSKDLENIKAITPQKLNSQHKTAILLVNRNYQAGIMMMEWVNKKFKGYFTNFVFISVGVIDNQKMASKENLDLLQKNIIQMLQTDVYICENRKIPATFYYECAADKIKAILKLTKKAKREYPDSIVFLSKITVKKEKLWNKLLHHKRLKLIVENLSNANIPTLLIPFLI